ncbi:MAG: class I SAM-dependent methyltransferase [Alphaproteobacteria bacterium]|nr:class I SAM-dependent methyltransferase [Alphaproteobacteria bacterium]
MTRRCPVCRSEDIAGFAEVEGTTYSWCARCQARFMNPEHHPSRAAEHAHYAHHRNDPYDPGYRRFLAKLSVPMLARLPAGVEGLDFGCGAGSALAAVFEEAGHPMALYDPAFAADVSVLQRTYDVITCTEVIEHLHEPAAIFEQLDHLLRPGGWLGLMTRFQDDDSRFPTWHYRRDPTHVVFYRPETLYWIADAFGWSCEIPEPHVALMQKPV